MITVVIVTFNRAAILEQCLESLSRHQTRCPGWRVLVVDNGSIDDTSTVVSRFATKRDNFDYVIEEKRGANRARNRSLKDAHTPYLLFVDDDCIIPSGYLDVACEIIELRMPVCFGGPIAPWFMAGSPRPAWFKDVYGSFSLPGNNLVGAPPRLSAGNLGASLAALRKVGGFDQAMGPNGKRMSFGEENALVSIMWDTFGADRVVYDPRLRNYHLVRPERFRWRNIIVENAKRGFARGRLEAAGLGESNRITHAPRGEDAEPGVQLSPQGLFRRCLAISYNVLCDALFLRLLTEPATYSCWQHVVYENWMGYVRRLGVVAGFVATKVSNHVPSVLTR